MIIQCESCIHREVCRNIRIVEQITKTIDAAIDHIEVTVEDKACGVKDLPWINLSKTAIACANYQVTTAYRHAMDIAQTCQNSINHMF